MLKSHDSKILRFKLKTEVHYLCVNLIKIPFSMLAQNNLEKIVKILFSFIFEDWKHKVMVE